MESRVSRNQSEAIAHLNAWKVGALFMEAGTGKTRVALNLVNASDADFCLWIAPLRTLANVSAELEKWGGLRMPVELVGVESLSQSSRVFLDMVEAVRRACRAFVVVDESLKIKNARAVRTKRVLTIGAKAEYKLILNGTPLTKNLMDLYPQMQFLSPQILNMTENEFKDTFCNYTQVYRRTGRGTQMKEYITGYANIDYLYSLIRHYVYECDLRMDITQNWHVLSYCLTDEERERYNEIKAYFLSLDGLEEWNNNIFLAMTQKMQHSYCASVAKIEAVRELFRTIDECRTIIFCKFIDSREACEAAFPGTKVLSYQKEAFGLNLQEYNNTIYFDKTFDWAQRVQASRRTYRTGQEYNCNYWDLTGDVGLEAVIDRNNEKKMSMAEYFKLKTKEQIKEEL